MFHRIYFSVCGEGYGHSSRNIAIAKVLVNAGADVLMGSYGYVLDRLSKSFTTVEIEREFEMVGIDGVFDIDATISQSKFSMLHFPRIILNEIKIIKNFKATCVVADGRNAAVFAALKLGLPCIIISNQTSLEHFFNENKFLLRLIRKPVDFVYNTIMAFADEILIPDFPPPDTVCLYTLSKSRHVMKKHRFIGPVVYFNHGSPKQNRSLLRGHPFVLTLLGGHSFRVPIFKMVLKIAYRFPDINFLIFTKFGSDTTPKNVTIKDFAEDISSYILAADLIITQAGHSTAMEILTFGKSAIIIPDKGQVEQENNAMRMRELGVCETLDYSSLNPESLFEKIDLLLSDSRCKKRAKYYSVVAKKMKGAEKAAEIILELSNRIHHY